MIMRHTILIISLFLAINLQAQETPVVTWSGLVSQKTKSDQAIENPKKNKKVKTWTKRGKLYYDISVFNTISVPTGTPAKSKGVNSVEFIVGKPKSVEKTGEGEEVWIYDHKKLYMKNGVLDRWEETEYIDKDAIKKSGEAYVTASQIDPDYMKKPLIVTEVQFTRDALLNKGVEFYQAKDFKKAYELMVLASKLGEMPRNEKTDTAFNVAMPYFNAGIIAQADSAFKESDKNFRYCIEKDYNGDNAYHNIALNQLRQGDSTQYIAVVKEGFEKYPDSETLVIDLINFYMSKDQPEMVIKYIDLAISKNPENPSYYSAKATIYDSQYTKAVDKYQKEKDLYYDAKKEAFRNRFEAKKKAEAEKKMAEAKENSNKYKKEYETAYNESIKLYNKALEIDDKFYNPLYNLGRLAYSKYELMNYESDYAFKVTKDSKAEKEYAQKAKDALSEAAGYFEKSLAAKPNDRNSIIQLKQIYYKLGNRELANKYREMLDNLGEENKSEMK